MFEFFAVVGILFITVSACLFLYAGWLNRDINKRIRERYIEWQKELHEGKGEDDE